MGTHYQQLSIAEHCEIARLSDARCSVRQIAAALDRAPSTSSRELNRNASATAGYRPEYAHQQAPARCWRGARPEANDRRTPGHWEADLMRFGNRGPALLLHERHSRLLLACRLRAAARAAAVAAAGGAAWPSTTARSLLGTADCIRWASALTFARSGRCGRRGERRMPAAGCGVFGRAGRT